VRYRDVYPGIDLIYYGNQGQLEYDFEVAPGSDPKQVALTFQGPHSLRIDAGGDLVLGIGGNDVRLQAPRVYQKFGAEERSVTGRFELRGKENEVGFRLGAYDRSRTLIIDPVLIYGTYLGGSGVESCSAITGLQFTPGCPAIAVDAVSNVYVAGSTKSTDFPGITNTSYQKTLATGATANVFIAKFDVNGLLQFATYLGGDGLDYPAGIGVDGGFDVIVAGTTSSSTFPTGGTNAAFQASRASAGNHAFVSKLDPAGATLLYSTYLSGDGADVATGLAVDSGGTAFVTGTTASSNFPTTLGALQTTPKAVHQSFFSRVDPNSSGTQSLMYSTYIGGGNPSTGMTLGGGIAVDTNSNAYITGGTNFTDMPVLNAFQGTLKAGVDAFVIKINPAGVSGTQLLYGTYLGGSGDDVGYGIAVDSTTNAYITGSTTSTDIVPPTGATAFQGANGGGTDAFLAKFGVLCTGTSCTPPILVPLNYFTYLGGAGTDVATAVAVDVNQGAHLTGWTNSTNFHLAGSPLQSTYGGGTSDAFVTRIDTLATTSDSSYFGGTLADMGTGITVDQQSATYVTGETFSPGGFPGHPFLNALNGPSDAFVSKLGPVLSLTFAPAPTASPSPVGVGGQVGFKYTITNSGEFTNGVTFTDHLQASGETFVSATSNQGTCGGASGTPPTVLCNIGALNAAAIATVTVNVTPVAPTLPGNSVILGNSGAAGIGGSTLTTAVASVKVNDFSLAVGPASATVPAGVPATFTATVAPSANDGFPGSVTLACGTGLPTGATCLPGNNNPIPNLNSGPQSSQLIINTTARVTTTTDLRHGGTGVPLYAAWLPVSGLALLGVRLAGKRSRRGRFLMGLLLTCFFGLIVFQAGCGSSKHTTTTIGTPAGTYQVTINATSGTNATRSKLVTLVVE